MFSSLGSCAALDSQEIGRVFFSVYCSFVRYQNNEVSKFQDFKGNLNTICFLFFQTGKLKSREVKLFVGDHL